MFETNYLWGMHLTWWILWMILIFWIFAVPYDIQGQRRKKESPLDILQMRFARGDISYQEYRENKKVLEADLKKH